MVGNRFWKAAHSEAEQVITRIHIQSMTSAPVDPPYTKPSSRYTLGPTKTDRAHAWYSLGSIRFI
jgi:hypothetical protein